MAMSKSQAEDLVKGIARSHGHLGEAVYSQMTAFARHEVEEAILAKDKLIGSTVITLAKNLYSKDVRFIFELLQNADDNLFGKARTDSEDPFVSFCLYHDKIIVDCNEDGFTNLNLKAICNVGQSSKHGAQGYIGEKGIGFKSVFKVARKVWIQSGPFSFCFEHRRGDSGMGMISPLWQETTEELAGPLTRMTFYLADDGDPNARAEQRRNIHEQLNDLKPEMLLFLNKLRRIEVRLHDDGGNETSSSVLSRVENAGETYRAVLYIIKSENGQAPGLVKKYYHVTKVKATGLAPNENRDYSDEEHTRRAYSTADVILAFPLTGLYVPIMRPQELFAFLPIRRVGFNFLIHSDFVTMANREDIVTSSLRNQDLCRQLGGAFITGVKQMCKHPQLRFKWMRYLPSLTGPLLDDPFWGILIETLRNQLADASIMVPRAAPSQLRPMGQLRRHGSLDQYGNPLFNDLQQPDAVYLSQNYDVTDLATLRGFGLKGIHFGQILSRVEADLRSSSSRMRSPETDNDWHSRAANVLLYPFKNSSANWSIPNVKALTLLPLCNGQWVKTGDNTVYFSATIDGIEIPRGLGLWLVDPVAASQPCRKELFLALGAEVASSETIRSLIFNHIVTGPQGDSFFKDTSIVFLRFFYLTHPENAPVGVYDQFEFLTASLEVAIPSQHDLYLEDDTSRYGPAKLELAVHFLHPDYLNDPPVDLKAWKLWLYKFVGIRTRLRLVCNDEFGQVSLAEEVLHVAEHRPTKFVGLLHNLLTIGNNKANLTDVLAQQLLSMDVLCDGRQMIPLANTILPLPGLRQLAARFMDPNEDLPFLKLETTVSDENLRRWDVLDLFGVVRNAGLSFYLTMIRTVSYCTPAEDVQRKTRIIDLYSAIHAQVTSSTDLNEGQQFVRESFRDSSYIFIPGFDGYEPSWCVWDACLLGAPADMMSRYPIDAIYSATFRTEEIRLDSVFAFFKDTLNIPSCTWRSFVTELEYLEDDNSVDDELIRKQYERLSNEHFDADDTEELKERFAEGPLICASAGSQAELGWHKVQNCIWSTATSPRGMINLATQYPALESFFVHTLGIQKLNLSMIYDELLSVIPQQTTVAEIKGHLMTFNSLLETGSLSSGQTALRLLENPILPIRYPDGQVSLRAINIGFVIVDHKSLGTKFRDRVKTLDFTDREIRTLEPFLTWAGLDSRYISRVVVETPSLGSGERIPVSDRRFDVSKKAHGLLRIATNFGSPRVSLDGQRFYDLLRNAETWETDGISSRLSLSMDGQPVTVEMEHGAVYIDEKADAPLRFYIPHDEETQDVCIQHTLPKMLVEWFMKEPGAEGPRIINAAAIGSVKGLLNAKPASVARLLEKDGMIDVDIPNMDSDGQDNLGVAAAPEVSHTPARSSVTSLVTLGDAYTPEGSEPDGAAWGQDTPLTDPFSSSGQRSEPARTFLPGGYYPGTQQRPEDERLTNESAVAYLSLLDHVVQAGRAIRFPSQGRFNMSQLRDALPGDVVRSAFSSSHFTTFRIGAAGELFVFEMLSRLNLPAFSTDNWTSNIRTFVKAHRDYRSMASWSGGHEISDLEYKDTSGAFTALLIENGHLPESWQNRTPKYHFEVKSTPQELGAPFYMSGQQHRKMKALSVTDDTVYSICRVFKLYSNAIDVMLCVDPPKLEREGTLEFSAEKYNVRVLS